MKRSPILAPILLLGWLVLAPACGDDNQPKPDIAEALRDIPGMLSAEELVTAEAGYRLFLLVYEQPANHDDPESPRFGQVMTLMHRDYDAPMVLYSTGYGLGRYDTLSEPTRLLGANQLKIEHRYFQDSRPMPVDWSQLTIAQAAADYHRIVTALAPLYENAWVSTGASKGGVTSILHRRFYPDDVDATVAYVAPISFSVADTRYRSFFDTVGDSAGNSQCREDVRTVQRTVLERRAEITSLAAQRADEQGVTFTRLGTLDRALDQAVVELEWLFWQYMGLAACANLPSSTATASELFEFVDGLGVLDSFSDQGIEHYEPYYYQSATQLGYPSVTYPHIADLVDYEPLPAGLLPVGAQVTFDSQAMTDIATWVREDSERMLLVYGEYDPWTTGAFDIAGNASAARFDAPQGTHGAKIASLEPDDEDAALALLEQWTGTAIERSQSARWRETRELPAAELRGLMRW